MKFKSLIAILLVAVMCLALVACGGSGDGANTTVAGADNTSTPTSSSQAPGSSAETPDASSQTPDSSAQTPDSSSQTPDSSDESSAPESTVAPITELEGAELEAYKLLLPALLPDNTADYKFNRFMSLDGGYDYYMIDGNSKANAQFVDTQNGALWGQAVKFPAAGATDAKRAEITLIPFDPFNVEGAKGIMFYIDLSNLEKKGEQHMCASVTINNNAYRSTQGVEKTAVAYYWDGNMWQETTNNNNIQEDGTVVSEACRLTLPDQFKGWVYVPASTYHNSATKDPDTGMYLESAAVDGVFGSIDLQNMRCYTDGYIFSNDCYIVFDEILYIY